MINYITIALLLLSGCAADVPVYNPTSWPRAIVIESALETEVEIEQVERVKRSVAMINKRVGAAVYQLAVTNDADAAGHNTIVIEYVDYVLGNDGEPTPNTRGSYISDYWPGKSYIQLRLRGRVPSDETVIVHELMHNLLGAKHDEIIPEQNPHSVFSGGHGCLVADPSVGYSPLEYCSKFIVAEITQDLVDRIRKVMKLP